MQMCACLLILPQNLATLLTVCSMRLHYYSGVVMSILTSVLCAGSISCVLSFCSRTVQMCVPCGVHTVDISVKQK